jgi:predicted RND superfamily exporter protein
MLEKFLTWSSRSFKHPVVITVIAVAMTIACACGIPFLKFDNNIRTMLPKDSRDLAVHDYYEDESRFGNSALIFVGVANSDIYALESLRYIKDTKDRFEALNQAIPPRMTARLLGLGEAEGRQVVEALRGLGVNEGSFAGTALPVLRDSTQSQSKFGWDKDFAARVAAAAGRADPALLYAYSEAPISKVKSVVNADYIANEDDTLVVKQLVDDENITADTPDQLRQRVAGWELYQDALVSRDGTLTTLLVELNTHNIDVKAELNKEIHAILAANTLSGAKTYIDGEPVIEDMIARYMVDDIKVLLPLVSLVVMLILFLCVRTVSGVLYPGAVILMSVISSVGIMSFCGIPMTVVGTAMPVLLVAIASAYGIHQMNHYYLDELHDKRQILTRNMGNVGLAITLSGITVMVGFGSLLTSNFVPVRNFGIFTALGDFVAIAAALWVLPALILVSKKPKTIVAHERTKGWVSSILKRFVKINRTHPGKAVAVSVLLTLVFLAGAFFVRTELNNVSFFKNDDPVHVADDVLNERLAGTQVLNLVLDSDLSDPLARTAEGEADPAGGVVDLANPAVLSRIEQFSVDVKKQFPYVQKVMSFNDILKKMNQEMSGDPANYVIPADQNLISQYFLMISSDTMKSVISPNHDKLRISLQMKRTGTAETEELRKWSVAYFDQDFLKASHARLEVTGAARLYYVANELLVHGTYVSIIVCVAIVFVLLLYVLRSFWMSMIALLPIFMTLVINFGILGIFNIPLNAGTAMVSSIAIGIGVDYSIHYITWYRSEMRRKADILHALESTIMHKGRAILYNMFVIVGGFMVMVVSKFVPLIQFGCLVSVCMVTTAVGALVVVPAVMRLLARRDHRFLYLGVARTGPGASADAALVAAALPEAAE